MSFPVPHIEEQKTIIDRIDYLSTICDQLETRTTQNQTHADALMQAVLREAFNQNTEEVVTAG